MRSIILPSFVVLLAACSGSQVNPHSNSVAGHEQEAAAEDKASTEHSGKYDPKQTSKTEHCDGSAATKFSTGSPCWTETVNPTDQHLAEAKEHEELAAKHRAAAKALQDAEAKSCVGVSNADRDMSPFHHKDDIAKVTFAGPTGNETSATIFFKPIAGLTVDSLQKIVDCHLARNAALGHVVPEMPYCPLVPNGAKATVSTIDGAIAVTVTDDDAAGRKDVIQRAKKLLGS